MTSFPPGKKTEFSSANPVDMMPGANSSPSSPGGFCPRYSPLSTGKSLCWVQSVKHRMTKIKKLNNIILLFMFSASFLFKFYFFGYENLKISALA